jgi:uncharacterized Zn-binding protein involved in type VI secretion
MAKPAARQGDSTDHGGSIASGAPTVLIGGMPAATATGAHICPMVTGTVPHVGGVFPKGSTSVLIGGLPALRVGDRGLCNGPPCTVASGCGTVHIGG